MGRSKSADDPVERSKLPRSVKLDVLTEAGYRCANPTCRTILTLDIHHIYELSEGGGDEAANLLALCPTCHAQYHRGIIARESVRAWKHTLAALNRAFDSETVDRLLFLYATESGIPLEVWGEKKPDLVEALKGARLPLSYSSEGVLAFYRLIAAGLAEVTFDNARQSRLAGAGLDYYVKLTEKGRALIAAWRAGNVDSIKAAIGLRGVPESAGPWPESLRTGADAESDSGAGGGA